MTSWLNVSDTTPRISYVATSGQTTFAVPFAFHSAAHLAVYKNSVLLTYVTHYVVTGVDEEAGGTVVLVTGATVSDAIVIERNIPFELVTHIPPSGPLDVPAINIQFALFVMMLQQLVANFQSTFTNITSGVLTWLGAPSSANLAAAVTNETGTGALVFGTSPTLGGAVTISKNNSAHALTLTHPDATAVLYDSTPVAAIYIARPPTPTTRLFDTGLLIETDGASQDRGRGILLLNYGKSDAVYVELRGQDSSGAAILLKTTALNATGMVIGTTEATQTGLSVRQETLQTPTAASSVLLSLEANGALTEMARINSTVASQTGFVFRMSGANANPIIVRNTTDSATVLQVTNTGGVLSAAYLLSTSPTSGVGYFTGAGGAVTQGTSRTTGVTLNTVSGGITLFTAAGSATAASFTVTNSAVAATDTISLSVKSGTNKYLAFATAVGAGSFEITFNTTGGTSSDAPVINFNVIKGVAA